METLLIVLALLTIIGIVAAAASGLLLRLDLQKFKKMKIDRLANCEVDVLFDEREIDSKCDICFGVFDGGPVVECTCGKAFHMDCVSMTKECPYCRQVPSQMKIRDARKKYCPVCGNELGDLGVCACGNALPRLDGVFRCACGKDIHMKDGHCRYCGAEYEPYYLNPTEAATVDCKR